MQRHTCPRWPSAGLCPLSPSHPIGLLPQLLEFLPVVALLASVPPSPMPPSFSPPSRAAFERRSVFPFTAAPTCFDPQALPTRSNCLSYTRSPCGRPPGACDARCGRHGRYALLSSSCMLFARRTAAAHLPPRQLFGAPHAVLRHHRLCPNISCASYAFDPIV